MKLTQYLLVALLPAALPAQSRLDGAAMRNNLFAAMAGSADATERILTASQTILQDHPEQPQALLWHGVGMMASFFQQAQKGKAEEAFPRLTEATSEMDRAVVLAPDDIEIRVMRAVLYGLASRNVPAPFAAGLLEKTREDLQHTFDLQKDHLAELGTHPLGELLQGLGDAYSRQGKAAEAAKYYAMMQIMLRDTEYARRATEWVSGKQPLPENRTSCVGCHSGR